MTEKTKIERRTFVQVMTAASSAALSLALLPRRAAGQSPNNSASNASDLFETKEIKTDDTPFSSGATGADPHCSWSMDFLEPA